MAPKNKLKDTKSAATKDTKSVATKDTKSAATKDIKPAANQAVNRDNYVANNASQGTSAAMRAHLNNIKEQDGGKWWVFSTDLVSYATNNPSKAYPTNPIVELQERIGAAYQGVYGDRADTEVVLYQFFKLALEEYREEYNKVPQNPEALYDFINVHFAKGSQGRGELNSRNPVDWDETATYYQNTTIAHGHILNFKQTWKADGYSLGDLLYSLPLAPCQKKQIAIFDWDRQESASREDSTSVSERLDAHLDRDRDVTDIVNTAMNEVVSGNSSSSMSSESKTRGFSANIGGSGSNGAVSVSGGMSFSSGRQSAQSQSSAQSFQQGARNLSGKAMQQYRDSIMQSSSAVRSQRATVVQAVRQGEAMRAQTEVIANHNHCHAITIQYFEVLRHFAIEQQLADVQECLFIPFEITPFTTEKLLRWQHTLRYVLRDRTLQGGFEALERIKDHLAQAGVQNMAQELIQRLEGELTLDIVINRPEDQQDEQRTFDPAAWQSVSRFLGISLSEVAAMQEEKSQAEREKYFQSYVAPQLVENFLQATKVIIEDTSGNRTVLPVYWALEGSYQARSTKALQVHTRSHLKLRFNAKDLTGNPLSRADIARIHFEMPTTEAAEALALPAGSHVRLVHSQARYRTAHLNDYLFRSQLLAPVDVTATDMPDFATPLNGQESVHPLQQDYVLANRLIAHVNEYTEYYHQLLWYYMDPNKRYMMLDGFIAPNSGGKSVASVIENKLIGIVGNNLVVPVARGLHLDPNFQAEDESGNPIDLLAHYQPTTPIPPFRVSVPTRGVYAEAVMGQCNSCEKIDESRFWRFNEVPCGDEPTAIQPISTDSRRSDPGNLQASPLAPSIINYQNVPNAPDPTGLAGALSAITNPDIFRDVTGLSETQKNALAALQQVAAGASGAMNSNIEAAKHYADNALQLAMNTSQNREDDKTDAFLQKMRDQGVLSEEEHKKLARQLAANKVGRGAPLHQEGRQPSEGDEGQEASSPSGSGEGGSVGDSGESEGGEEGEISMGSQTNTEEENFKKFFTEENDSVCLIIKNYRAEHEDEEPEDVKMDNIPTEHLAAILATAQAESHRKQQINQLPENFFVYFNRYVKSYKEGQRKGWTPSGILLDALEKSFAYNKKVKEYTNAEKKTNYDWLGVESAGRWTAVYNFARTLHKSMDYRPRLGTVSDRNPKGKYNNDQFFLWPDDLSRSSKYRSADYMTGFGYAFAKGTYQDSSATNDDKLLAESYLSDLKIPDTMAAIEESARYIASLFKRDTNGCFALSEPLIPTYFHHQGSGSDPNAGGQFERGRAYYFLYEQKKRLGLRALLLKEMPYEPAIDLNEKAVRTLGRNGWIEEDGDEKDTQVTFIYATGVIDRFLLKYGYASYDENGVAQLHSEVKDALPDLRVKKDDDEPERNWLEGEQLLHHGTFFEEDLLIELPKK
ncbi:MAG: hypothetical protein AAFP93_00745 [Bacteroidota bacterium]